MTNPPRKGHPGSREQSRPTKTVVVSPQSVRRSQAPPAARFEKTIVVSAEARRVPARASRPPAPLDFDTRSAHAAAELMETLYILSRRRAEAMRGESGLLVEVVYPAHAPAGLLHAATDLRFMKLSVPLVEVYLYSARIPGKPPTLNVPADEPARGAALDMKAQLARRQAATTVCRIELIDQPPGYQLVDPGKRRLRDDVVVEQLFKELLRRRHRVNP